MKPERNLGVKVTKRDRDWLGHFASGERERSRGMGLGGVYKFVSRKWIVRIKRDVDFEPELYRLIPEGLAALERIRGNGG